MRALDEVAEAINRARSKAPRPVISTFGLQEQFGRTLTPRDWAVIKKYLACELPPLQFSQGHWFLPDGLATIWDLTDRAADAHPDWDPPTERTEAAWREAQIFVGVRETVAEASGADPQDVTRESRFADLFGY